MECASVESCTKQNRNEAAEKMLATMSANTLKRDKEIPKQGQQTLARISTPSNRQSSFRSAPESLRNTGMIQPQARGILQEGCVIRHEALQLIDQDSHNQDSLASEFHDVLVRARN